MQDMNPQTLAGDGLIDRDLEHPSISKCLVRSASHKLRRKNPKNEPSEDDDTISASLRCLTLYGRAGGCKVSADMSEELGDLSSRRRLSASEVGKGQKAQVCRKEEKGSFDCFSHAMKEKFFRRNSSNRKHLLLTTHNQEASFNSMTARLPDDILEMCLVRLPLVSLMSVRLVCRKWRNLTLTPRFMQIRRDGLFQSPWLFLFGVVRDGYCSGEIHAFDVSLDQWHKIDSHALRGRFLFSLASVNEDVYVVGGRSSLTNFGRVDRSSFKTHKGVLVFSPLTKSWRKAATMKHARSSPVLGVSDVSPDCIIFNKNQQSRSERRLYRPRAGGASDVYEDPHRLSVRPQYSRHSLDENDNNTKFARSRNETSSGRKLVIMIAVGGLGPWDEPLDTGEIYEPVSNKWTEIQRLPLDFGPACSGAICRGVFYVCSETDSLAGYDLERGYWVRIRMGSSLARVHEYYPKLVCCGGRLLMVSVSWCEGDGQIGRRNKAVRKLWEMDPAGIAWGEVSAHPDAPMDWNAEFVADGEFIFGVEMFKIFGQVLDFVTVFDVQRGRWDHISRNRLAHRLDASSCMTKSVAVMRL